MTTEDYIKISEALQTQMTFVADRATEIIYELAKEYADDDDGTFWLSSVDNIYINKDRERIVYIRVNECQQVFVGVYNDDLRDEGILVGDLLDINPTDRIKIADYLAERY